MDFYVQQANKMTDSRQQAKVKHAFKDILVTVFFGVLAGNDEWKDIYDFTMDERETGMPQRNTQKSRKTCVTWMNLMSCQQNGVLSFPIFQII